MACRWGIKVAVSVDLKIGWTVFFVHAPQIEQNANCSWHAISDKGWQAGALSGEKIMPRGRRRGVVVSP